MTLLLQGIKPTPAIIWTRRDAPGRNHPGNYSEHWPNKPTSLDLVIYWHTRARVSGTFTAKAAAKWSIANLALKVGEVQARRLLREAGILPNPKPPKLPKLVKLPERKAA
jgi:hypothetical protein